MLRCNWYEQTIFEAANRFRQQVESKNIEEYRCAAIELRKEMVKLDASYPKYHFVAPEGWVGTPDVYLHYKGRYHMFYQYIPTFEDGRISNGMGVHEYFPNNHLTLCWGHAVSEDLVHWKDMPIALCPEEEYECGGCLSGQAYITEDGTPLIFYNSTGHIYGKELTLVVAKPQDDMLNHWEKKLLRGGDETFGPDIEVDYVGELWKEGDTYYMTSGRRYQEHGAGFLMTSKNLEDWEFASIVFERGNDRTWETPRLFRMNDKYILMVGYTPRNWGEGIMYWTGDFSYETLKFTPDQEMPRFVDLGNFYSHVPLKMGPDEKMMLFGLMDCDKKTVGAVPYWSGAFTMPRDMWLQDGVICQRPIEAFDSLITETEEYGALCCNAEGPITVKDTTDAYKLTFTREKGRRDKNIRLSFLTGNNLNREKVKLTIEPSGTLTFEADERRQATHLFNPLHEVTFHIYVDCSIIEIYLEEKVPGQEKPLWKAFTNMYNLTGYLDELGYPHVWHADRLNGVAFKGSEPAKNVSVSKMGCIWE